MQTDKTLLEIQGFQVSRALVAGIADAGVSPEAALVGLTLAASSLVATLIATDPKAKTGGPGFVKQRQAAAVDAFRLAVEEYQKRANAVTPEQLAAALQLLGKVGSYSELSRQL